MKLGQNFVKYFCSVLRKWSFKRKPFEIYKPLVSAEFKCTVHVVLPKWPINQFKPVQQSRQQVLRAYCPNIYTMPVKQGLLKTLNLWTQEGTSCLFVCSNKFKTLSISLSTSEKFSFEEDLTNSPLVSALFTSASVKQK